MSEYAIQAAAFSESINIGRLNKAGTEFTDKQERTDMALYAVARYVLDHFGGDLTVDWPQHDLKMNVAVIETDLGETP